MRKIPALLALLLLATTGFLEVRDNGSPSLVGYQRVIFNIK